MLHWSPTVSIRWEIQEASIKAEIHITLPLNGTVALWKWLAPPIWKPSIPVTAICMYTHHATFLLSVCVTPTAFSFTPKHTHAVYPPQPKGPDSGGSAECQRGTERCPEKPLLPLERDISTTHKQEEVQVCHTLTPRTTHGTSKFIRTYHIHSLLQTYPQPWSFENLLGCGWCTADWRYTSWVESTNAILFSK